jgi:hypothetical protein
MKSHDIEGVGIMPKSVVEQGYDAQARALREFGYPDATSAMIREAHRKWLAGEEPEGIIEMMSIRAFEDYPNIFGAPPESA